MDSILTEREIFERGMNMEMTCIWRFANGRIKIERMDAETRRTVDYVEFSPTRRIVSFTECSDSGERIEYTGADAVMRAAATYAEIQRSI